MAKEIERKYLVVADTFKSMAVRSRDIRQAYISDRPEATVRVRVRGSEAFLTVKGINQGCTRNEWEYPIPVAEAEEMAHALAGGFAIDKTRYEVPFGGFMWEVDCFHGRHEGLILAEVELPTAYTQPPLPPFVGQEVTDNPQYYNSVLAKG